MKFKDFKPGQKIFYDCKAREALTNEVIDRDGLYLGKIIDCNDDFFTIEWNSPSFMRAYGGVRYDKKYCLDENNWTNFAKIVEDKEYLSLLLRV